MTSTFIPVNDFFSIGRSLKSHGISGQLRLMIEDRFKSYVQPGSFLFFNLDGSRVPFKVSFVDDSQHFVVTLDGFTNKQESDKMTAKEIWISMDLVKPKHLKSPKNINAKWDDFRIADTTSETTYKIIRTEEYPQQLMAVVEVGEKEILIPLHEQLISDINYSQKIITMNIPEGLLEL